MRMEDMILVSIDDHSIEPPDMYDRHLPAKYRDQAPKIVRNDQGIDQWVFQGQATSTPFGMAATVGWPHEEWGFNPGAFSELRPGCFDVHERVRDMNANGVLASMCFPTMAGFNARTFTEAADKDPVLRDAPGLQRLAHRRVVCRLPRPVHPAGHRADVGRRPGRRKRSTGWAEGIPRGQLPRGSPRPGMAELPVRALGPHARGHHRREHGALPAHRGCPRAHPVGAGGADRPPDRDPDADDHARGPGSPLRADVPQVPGAEGGALRGRHRLDPVLPRPASTVTSATSRGSTTTSEASCRPRCSATTSSPASSPTPPVCRPATRSGWTSWRGSATTPTPTPRGPSPPKCCGASWSMPRCPTTRSTRSPGRIRCASSIGIRSPTSPRPSQPSARYGPWRATWTRPE